MSAVFIAPDGHPDKIDHWLAARGCSNCAHCGMDMDMDPYCSQPKVIRAHPWGLDISIAVKLFCGNPHTLWEKRK